MKKFRGNKKENIDISFRKIYVLSLYNLNRNFYRRYLFFKFKNLPLFLGEFFDKYLIALIIS